MVQVTTQGDRPWKKKWNHPLRVTGRAAEGRGAVMQRHGAGGGLPPATAGNCARVCASVTARGSRRAQRARSRPRTAHTFSHTCAVQHGRVSALRVGGSR